MKDAFEVLRQKEVEFARIRKEVESLNIVARLLEDDELADQPIKKASTSATDTLSGSQPQSADDSNNLGASSRSGLLNALKRAK